MLWHMVLSLSPDVLAAADVRLPLYQRLFDVFAGAIAAGDVEPSAPLPGEDEIARTCQVSLGTVRLAMSRLADAGLVERRQGHGTFVKRGDFSHSMSRFFRFGVAGGVGPRGRILSSHRMEADRTTVDALQIEPAGPVLRLERLRFLADEPVVHEVIWLPLPLFEPVAQVPVNAFPDLLYPFYEECAGVVIGRAVEELTVATAGPLDVERLSADPGSPVVVVERVAHAVAGRPVERRISRGDATAFRYRVEIS